ncbi:MAG: hypothetical protein ACREDL_22605 [Bradyrhizobium sp.]
MITVAEGGERQTICDDLSATSERSLSNCRNPGLANHVSGPKQPFNDLNLRIGYRIGVFIPP